jgi:hypothetical protein
MKPIIVQKLKKVENNVYAIAEKYYSILSVINNLKLTKGELQLVAFTAINKNISYKYLREEFCLKYKTNNFTINNIVSKLKKLGVLIKVDGKVKVNPVIVLDFNNTIKLEITLENE